jgi:MFS family permease
VKSPILLYLAGTFFFWFSQYIYVPILAPYLVELECSLSMIGIILGSYGISQFLFRTPLGFWSDRKKIFKPFVLIGVCCSGLSCLGFALFPSAWSFLGARTLSGMAASFWVVFTVGFASYFPEGESPKAMGQLVFCMSGALLVSSVLGGWIAEHYGNEAPFWVGVLSAVISLLAFAGVKEEKAEARAPGMSLKKGAQVAASPVLILVSLVGAAFMFNLYTTIYGFLPLLAVQLGSSKTQLGLLTACHLASYSVASLMVGTRPLNRLSERLLMAIASFLVSLTALLLPFVHNLPLLYASQIVNGFGRGLSYPILLSLVFRLVPPAERATAMGVFQSVYALGIFAGPLLGGWVGNFWGMNGIFILGGVSTLLVIPFLWRINPFDSPV